MGSLLEVKGLCKSYGDKNALRGINLEIEAGKVIGLVGPNGSGKSTLIKLINGLLQETEGEIRIEGEVIGEKTKSKIAYLPERTYLNNWMKVEDLINFFGDFYQDFDRGRAETMLENLKIEKGSRLRTLSKGTKEKVQLVLVMARRAKLYILDEPIGGVDPAGREYILNTIIKNYSEESTLIIATHLINEVENICDDIIFLNEGEIMMHGNVDDIREAEGKSMDALFREVFKC